MIFSLLSKMERYRMTEIENKNQSVTPESCHINTKTSLYTILMMIVFKPFQLSRRVNSNVTHLKVSLMSKVNERIIGR